MDEALYTDPDLAGFYDLLNPWGQDFDYCVAAAKRARQVLDIGCGTGELAVALAQSAQVTGVDPAQAMLDIASKRPGGAAVTWVQGDVRTLDLGAVFDLIVMTGHAFQTLLTDADQAAALAAMKRHLAPDGRLIFDTRNPVVRAWEGWNETQVTLFEHPVLGKVEKTTSHLHDGEIVSYTDRFRVLATGEERQATSHLRFREKAAMDGALAEAGLAHAPCYGTWRGTPWAEEAPELLYDVGHAERSK